MPESAKQEDDLSLEASTLNGAVPLESILCTEELRRRPRRPPNYAKENRALAALAKALVDCQSNILQILTETILEVTDCDSAGLSLLTEDDGGKRFYWPAIAGAWNPYTGGGTPRDNGPCGDVLDRNCALVFRHFERRYTVFLPVMPAAEESLIVPFYVDGSAVGTMWAIMHTDRRVFDAEDERIMTALGRFTSVAYQTLKSVHDLKTQVAAREKAESALQEFASGLEVRIRRLVDANIMGIVFWDLEGKITEANEAFLHIVQYSREDLVSGKVNWKDLTPAEWHGRDDLAITELRITGAVQPYEKEYFRKDGSRAPVLVGAALFERSRNEGVAFLLDLSEQKRAQEAARESERSFRLVVDGIAGLVAIMSPEGTLEYVNNQVLDYFGKTVEDLRYWALSDAVHQSDLPNTIAAWKNSVETGEPYDIDHRLRRADGRYRWFHARGLCLRDGQDRIVRWYVLLTDIDERKKAEEKLRRSEGKLQEAQRLTHTGSWTLDPFSNKVDVSPEILRIFCVGSEEDTSAPDFWFDRIHPEDRQRVREHFESCVFQKLHYEDDYRIVLPDGTLKYQHSIGHPVLDETGALVEFLGTAMDVTDQVQATTKLEQAFDQIKILKDQLYQENLMLKEEIDQASMFEEIVGSSEPLKRVLNQIAKVAPTDSTVLILGETGTGKELVARALHRRSNRSRRAFIRVNCAAIPQSLISSELFGHEKGSFTGAAQRHIGRFESADGGTIFLDEIGEIPVETQIALLRVLQEHEFERIGGERPIGLDVRVIAATNRDLNAALASGAFRQDLFYRLNVVPIVIPPLRERRDDIPLLVEYLIERYATKAGRRFSNIRKKTMELFQGYDWPGNVRELQNVIERAVVLCDSDTFSVEESWLRSESSSRKRISVSFAVTLAEREREMIETALSECNGRIAGPKGAAAKLGIPRQTLDSKIANLGIDKNRFHGKRS